MNFVFQVQELIIKPNGPTI